MLGGVGQLMRPSLVEGDYVAPGILLPPLTLTRSQSVGAKSTALGSDGTTWQTYAADVPRVNGTAQRLLIGGARTNSVRNVRFEGGTPGVIGSGGVAPTNMVIVAPTGVTVTFNGVGAEFNLPYIELRFVAAGATTTTPTTVLFSENAAGISASSGQVWSQRFFTRLVSGSLSGALVAAVAIQAGGTSLIGPTFAPSSSLTEAKLENFTISASTTALRPSLRIVNVASDTYDFVLRVYCFTAEQATFASTPILPAVGTPAASTRGADLISATLASLGIGANGACTVLWSGMIPQAAPSGVNQTLFQIDDGSDNNRLLLLNANPGLTLVPARTLAGAFSAGSSIGSFAAGTPFAAGVTFSGGRAAGSFNGAAIQAVTGGPSSSLTTFRLGSNAAGSANLFGETARLSILPYALSDAALQAAVAAFPTS